MGWVVICQGKWWWKCISWKREDDKSWSVRFDNCNNGKMREIIKQI